MKYFYKFIFSLIFCSFIAFSFAVGLAEVEEHWNCPNCGSLMITDYCTKCGTKKPTEIVCSSCGEKYPADSGVLFCGKCGAKLSEKSSDKSEESKDYPKEENGHFGMWDISQYVDEFNRPTSSRYIKNKNWIKGIFSNSATNNSSLNVKILVDKNDISIMLYEYDDHQVKSYGSYSVEYLINVLDALGNKHTMIGKMYSDRIIIQAEYIDELLSILAEGGEISFSIVERNYKINNYLFTIMNASNFDAAYKKLTGRDIIPISVAAQITPTPSPKEIKEKEERKRFNEIVAYAKEIAEPIGFDGYWHKSSSQTVSVNKKQFMVSTSLINVMHVFDYFFKNGVAVKKSLSTYSDKYDYEQMYNEIVQMLREMNDMSSSVINKTYFNSKYAHMPK